jgi:hypothetical protein
MFPAFLFKPVLLLRFEYRLNHAARAFPSAMLHLLGYSLCFTDSTGLLGPG